MLFGKENHTDSPGLPDVLKRIRDRLPHLSGEEKLLAEYIMLNYEGVPHLSLVQLAEKAEVHPSAVVRFCGVVDCDGFHGLHTALAEIESVGASVFFNHFCFSLREEVCSSGNH